MRKSLLAVAVVGGLLAGCSQEASVQRQAQSQSARSAQDSIAQARHGATSIASLPDRGNLLAYDRTQAPVRRGAYTWHPVQLSEAYALRAIADGSMHVNGPAGQPIELKYERHVEHADGNWTWIGRVAGAGKGAEAVLTFGKDAVFGTIANGNGEPLQVTTASGRTWVVETDAHLVAVQPPSADNDFLTTPAAMAAATNAMLPMHGASMHTLADAKPMAASAVKPQSAEPATLAATVDLVVGYTTGFATRLGGQSEALTRLNFMVDVANQAYGNSEVAGRLRLVQAIQLDYPDNTTNRSTLFALSGQQCTTANGTGALHVPDGDVNCAAIAVPAALQPLITAREQSRADLAAIVRTFQSPENQSCGVAWLLGGGQRPINANNAAFGLAVISDSGGQAFPDPDNGSTCRDETLAHELGHNMGLAHDRVSAAGSDDTNSDNNTLDPEEYGRYADSFGYSAGADAGNFYTIMSIPQAGQTSFRVFSNPRVTFCGGLPCGETGAEDNARTLSLTMPVIAAFRTLPATNVWYRGDFDGDGRSDILWRNTGNGNDAIWKSGNAATPQAVTGVSNQTWAVAGAADFDGDNKADILWHNTGNGANVIWKSGNSTTTMAVTSTALAWTVAGAGDFDGDGKADILWRNTSSGANVIWKSGSSATPQAVTTVPSQAWTVAGVADFDGDHKADILWRNTASGTNTIWKSGNSATPQAVASVALAWVVAGTGDFDGDTKADILWRNLASGQNVIFKSGNQATPQAVTGVNSQSWVVVGVGDFDGDHKADILWHNVATGQNSIWKSANLATPQAVSTVGDLTWSIAG